MGEVYRAQDGKLGREVALKVLPDAFAEDPERLARFQREARTLASLQHPNVAAIFGLEEAGGGRFLVMELVEGADLAQRLTRGPLPVAEAMDIARQIAAGLEEAHEKGIVHRDLKPANIRITPDGRVKILDFGLARALTGETTAEGVDLSTSPTLPAMVSQQGVILGTAAYMSPEQARGKNVDRRADVWAFGVVLFEMLTGRQLFAGETVSDTLASVLKTDPDWDALPADTPASLRRVLRRCLAKDARRRLRSAADAALDLDADEPGAPASSPRPRSARAAWATAAVLALALIASVAGRFLRHPVPAGPDAAHLEFRLPPETRVPPLRGVTISPDGKWVVFVSGDATSPPGLWVRSLDSFEAEPIPDTEGAMWPFWSPDSRSVAYFTNGKLNRVDIATRTSQIVCDNPSASRGGAWSPDGTILFAPDPNSGLFRVSASGGPVSAVTSVDSSLVDGSHRFPVFLPDGKHFLFLVWSNNSDALHEKGGIYAGSLDGGPPRRVLADPSSCVFVPPDRLLVHRDGKLMSVDFDPRALTSTGTTTPLDEGVLFLANYGFLPASVAMNGTIAYGVGESETPVEMVWLDGTGKIVEKLGSAGPYEGLALSRDRSHYAVEKYAGTEPGQIWVGDLTRGTLTPLTRGANDSYGAVWSPAGDEIAYANRDSGDEDIYIQSTFGTTPRKLVFNGTVYDTDLTDWSPDGRYILFRASPKTGGAPSQVWAYDTEDGEAKALLADDFAQFDARLSPDGSWLAYTSLESGHPQIFVRPFPSLDRKWLVSPETGLQAWWSRDGTSLFYFGSVTQDNALYSVTVSVDASGFHASRPVKLFDMPADIYEAAPGSDANRLLALHGVRPDDPGAVRIILGHGGADGR